MFSAAAMPVPLADVHLPDPAELPLEERLFRHRKRDQWGVGLWVGEERTRRALTFEDGETRKFKRGFYHMLELVEDDSGLGGSDLDEWAEQVVSQPVEESAEPPVMPWSRQIATFEQLFVGGFAGEPWRDSHRARADGRATRKSHMERAISEAQTLLAKDAVVPMWMEGHQEEIFATAMRVASRSAMVAPAKDLRGLAALGPSGRQLVAEALVELLHADAPFKRRFKAWTKTLKAVTGRAASWRLATVFPALMEPERHVCVRPKVTQLQLAIVGRSIVLPKNPNPRGYRAARKAIRAVRDRLLESGHAPVDLVDCALFTYETLRPRGQRVAAALGTQSA